MRRFQYFFAIVTVLLGMAGSALLIIFGYISPAKFMLAAVGLGGTALLLIFPEIALAGLLVIGTLKGIPQLADSPIDLTVALAALATLGGLVKSGRDVLAMRIKYPKAYLAYLPFLAIMLLSLTYTPNFDRGLDKVGRFVVFVGIAVLVPFLVLRTRAAFMRFFLTLLALGLVVAIDSFGSLGGKERLVSNGGDTIQLGHDAAVAIVMVWYLLLPGRSLIARIGLYGLVMALCVAVVGAGSRGPAAALVCCIALSFVLHKNLGIRTKSLLLDLGILTLAGLLVIPIVGIPQASFDYLARLGDPNVHRELGPREALMETGWHLTVEHPITGVGIGGFPVVFRGIGAWPHNMFLEIGSEMGIFSTLLFAFLLWCGFREALRQVTIKDFLYGPIAATVFAFFVLEFLDIMNTGSLNDNRAMWMAIALPFALKNLRAEEPMFIVPDYAEPGFETPNFERHPQDVEVLAPTSF